jgi:raffinose/stachyose/melibiose transport system substrate-binding protein
MGLGAGTAGVATLAACAGAQKVIWWDIAVDEPNKSIFDGIVADFNAQNPNVQVEKQTIQNDPFKTKLAAAMQAGTPPDLFQSWGGGVLKAYVDAGLMQDITEAIKDFSGTLSPAAVGVYSFDGKTYAVPFNQGMVGFWYNTDLFSKAGVEVPKTWTDYLAATQKIKDAGITPIGLGNKDKWPGHFWWSYLNIRIGGKEAFDAAFNRTGSFADPPFVDAGAKLKELIDLQPFPKGFEALDFDQQSAIMGNGEAAMELMGQWAPGNQKAKSKDEQGIGDKLGFFTFPAVADGKGDASDVLGGCDGIAVSKNAPSGAIDFLRFFSSVDNAKKINAGGGSLSTVAGAAETIPDPLLKQVADLANQAKYFQVYYDQYLPPATGEAVKDATQALFIGKMSPEDVAKTVEAAAATELKE